MPVVGLEPTRIAPHDFESCASAIPPHRRHAAVQQYRQRLYDNIFEIKMQAVSEKVIQCIGNKLYCLSLAGA